MEIIDLPRPAIDVSPFVTYQTEEFVTPTEQELVEELPAKEGFTPVSEFVEPKEKKPFRGTGYLRAEAGPEDEKSARTDDGQEEDEWAEFGIGIDSSPLLKSSPPKPPGKPRGRPERPNRHSTPKPPSADNAEPLQKADAQKSGDKPNDDPSTKEHRKGRRRRRSRKGGNREGQTQETAPASQASQAKSSPAAAASVSASSNAPATTSQHASSNQEGDAAAGEKRKRRRRGRKRKPGSGSGTGSGDTGPTAQP